MSQDPMLTEFAYAPLDYVRISVFGVNYRGRVMRCSITRGVMQEFLVEYVNDGGDFKDGTFLADELSPDTP